MKIFKNRVFAILMAVCMMFSLLPASALAATDGADADLTSAPADGGEGYSLTFDLNGTGVTWYAKDEEGAAIDDEGYAIPLTDVEVNDDGDVPAITLTTTLYVKADKGYALGDPEDLELNIYGDGEDEEQPSTLDIEITDEAEYCDLKVTLTFEGYAVEGTSAVVELTIDADPVFDLSIDVDGTGVIWYAEDKAGAEISDDSFAVPATEITVNEDGEVPTITVTTTVYVKADRGYAIGDPDEFGNLTSFAIEVDDNLVKPEDLPSTLDIEITNEGLDYCDLMITLKFEGYAVKGESTNITLTLDAEPVYDLSIEVDGTGVTWYAADKAGAEISDDSFAVPATEITVNEDGEVPTITLTTTIYVKADRGYAIGDPDEFGNLTSFAIEVDDNLVKPEDLPSTLDIEITDEGLEYCDLMITLKFEGYAVKGESTIITLTLDAEHVYDLSIDVDGTGVTWYAADKAGAEISDENFAVPATEITLDEDGEVPTITVTTTVYVKADEGYVLDDLEKVMDALGISIDGTSVEDKELPSTLTIEITDEDLEYCDLKVTLKFEGYVVEGESTIITLTLDAVPEAPVNPFTDVSKTSWYYDAVMWAYKEGVTTGKGDGTTFAPGADCTREEFVTFLWRAAGSQEPTSTENPFSDVSEGTPYYKAILWANENGIANGTGGGKFSPKATVKRGQAVTFMHRYAVKYGKATETGTASFSDVTNTGEMANYYESIGWAQANGISNGNNATANTFGPLSGCNRGEMVTFLYRLFTDATA